MKSLTLNIPEALEKTIRLYSSLAKGEISWIGEIENTASGILITKIFLLKQATTPDNTKLDDDAYAKFILDYVSAGNDVSKLKLWLHSHGDFGVCWSVKDETTIENHHRADFFVSLVTNKAGEYLARVDIFKPLRVTVPNVFVRIIPEFTQEQILTSQKEIGELLTYTEPVEVGFQKGRRHYESLSSKRHSPA